MVLTDTPRGDGAETLGRRKLEHAAAMLAQLLLAETSHVGWECIKLIEWGKVCIRPSPPPSTYPQHAQNHGTSSPPALAHECLPCFGFLGR